MAISIFRTNENLDVKVCTKFNHVLHLYLIKSQSLASNLQCLEQLGKRVLQINAINRGKGAKNSTIDNTGLKNKLLLLKSFCVIITRNFWTLGELVNGIIGTVYNMIWEDKIEDPFVTMLVVILMAVNNYIGPASMVVNGVHMLLIVLVEA